MAQMTEILSYLSWLIFRMTPHEENRCSSFYSGQFYKIHHFRHQSRTHIVEGLSLSFIIRSRLAHDFSVFLPERKSPPANYEISQCPFSSDELIQLFLKNVGNGIHDDNSLMNVV